MKVTLVNEELLPVPPVLGGPVEQVLYETAISVKGTELTAISPFAEQLNGLDMEPAGMFFHVNVDEEASRLRAVMGAEALSHLQDGTTKTYFCYLNGVTDLLHKIEPDVIEIHNRPEFVPYMLKQFPGKQVVLYMHNEPTVWPLHFGEVLPAATAFVFVSQFLADRFVERYPASGKKVRVIHNSVDTDVWHPRVQDVAKTQKVRKKYGLKPGRTVLFVGRTVYEKGVHCLLEAMAYVRCHLPDAKLLVVGSPLFGALKQDAYVDALKRQAALLGDGVVFSGYVPPDKTPYLYGAADVTVVPSLCLEGFGKVVIESMSTGVPVVASRRGGIPEIVSDGQDGVLVDNPADSKALANHIVSVLKDRNKRQMMGNAARKKAVTYFDTSIRLAAVEAFYTHLKQVLR